MRPLLLVSDCHISPFRSDGTAEALAQLLLAHPQAELILNGDTWDLSCGAGGRPVSDTLAQWVLQAPRLAEVLAARLGDGVPVTIVAGNHDAALADPAVGSALRVALRVRAASPLGFTTWWTRRGGLHIEHGHLFDPDNAPLFPLGGPYRVGEEPLGVALMRRFVAPSRAFAFAHAHETTPLVGLGRSLRDFGPRAPLIILAYYRTALALTVEAARLGRVYDHGAAGSAWLSTVDDAQRADSCESALSPARDQAETVSAEALVRLLKLLPPPTHTNGRATLERLYLDRSLAVAALWVGLALGWSSLPGVLAGGSGAAYLLLSLLRRPNRYAGNLEASLESAACAIAGITGAERVVFGHTHQQQSRGPYVNLGAFGMAGCGARCWAYVSEHGEVSLERCSAT